MIKTFNQAVKFLERYIPTPEKKHPGELGLKRMEYLMDLLGNPQFKYPTIHVGGTSGKSSTATIIASILATKYKVGLHTSPHLVSITERIKILQQLKMQKSKCKITMKNSKKTISHPELVSGSNNHMREMPKQVRHDTGNDDISEKKFIELANEIPPIIKKMEKSEYGSPSYFEIVTAMAFLYFHMQKVDFAVIEVGMGGRYDATNVIKPLVAVLTNVGLDHTEILGDTVEKIAEDKAGIIKSNIQVVTGAKQSSVIKIINAKCKMQNAKLNLLNRDFGYKIKSIGEEGSVFDYYGKSGSDLKGVKGLTLSLLGEHQVENAVLALRTVESLSSRARQLAGRGISRECELEQVERFLTSFGMTEMDIRLGLNSAFILGRLEIVSRNPLVILDGAHNPDKVKALVASIKKIFPNRKITSIIAIKNDKNAKGMLVRLLAISEKVIFTKFQLKGDVGIISSYDPKLLLLSARNINIPHRYSYSHSGVERRVTEMMIIEDPKKAVTETIVIAEENDLILVTGSLYLVGEVKKFLISND